ncbi:DNA cytosine methyltransferase [Sedimentitalea sp. XS_ASV28]|uniref:DNA cytosine methyltransferase n=1 Tax=Sedimentitalea sp. XS_ASV28 TaxID=3241296 RepID=UPI003518F4FE
MVDQVEKIYSCIDLFAGAGGFSLAAAQSGFSVRLAIENDKHASRTLSDNIGKFQSEPCRVLNEDILCLDPQALASEIFQGPDECDLVLGGPPCQGFSTHRIKDAGVGDERNKLINTYFEFVAAFKPKAFLMENVPGMLWDRHKEYLEEFYEAGKEAGYEVRAPEVLDARDFGVPQRRKRVFILGIRKDQIRDGLNWPPAPTHVNPKYTEDANELLPWNDCSSAFSPAGSSDPNNVHMNHSAELVRAFASTPHNGGSRKDSNRLLPCHENHDGHKDVYGRIDPASPAPTMTTACINPSKGRFVHPTENHGITLRQAARIQTFPDNVVFQGGLIAAGKQIGNAVPITLGVALLKHLRNELEFMGIGEFESKEIRKRVAAE